MEKIFFTSNPIMLLMLLGLTVILIIVGRKTEIPQLPVIVITYSLGFLIYHTIGVNNAIGNTSNYYFSIAVDLILLFLGFITYLWIDNIVAKNKALKSYGDPLWWFWDKL